MRILTVKNSSSVPLAQITTDQIHHTQENYTTWDVTPIAPYTAQQLSDDFGASGFDLVGYASLSLFIARIKALGYKLTSSHANGDSVVNTLV